MKKNLQIEFTFGAHIATKNNNRVKKSYIEFIEQKSGKKFSLQVTNKINRKTEMKVLAECSRAQ